MKSYEFKDWFEYTKSLFPNFQIANSNVRDLWLKVLSKYSFEEAKNAVTIYATETKSSFPPNTGQISEILRNNTSVDKKEVVNISPDYPEKRFHEDIALGTCHHNLYCYRDAAVMLKNGEVSDFEEGLKLSCRRRTAARGEEPRDFEFPSDNDLKEAGLAGVKVNPVEAQRLLESFIRRWREGYEERY